MTRIAPWLPLVAFIGGLAWALTVIAPWWAVALFAVWALVMLVAVIGGAEL